MADLKTEQQITEELRKQRALAKDGRQSDATRQERAETIKGLEKELSSILSEQVKAKKIYNKIASDANKIEKDTSTSIISRLQSLAKGNLEAIFSNKAATQQKSLQQDINIEAKSQADVLKDKLSKDKLSAAAYGQTLGLVEKIKSGLVEQEDISGEIANINTDGQDIAKGLQNDFERLAGLKKEEGEEGEKANKEASKQAKIVAQLGVGFATLLSLATKFGSAIDKIGQTFGSLNVLGKEVTDNLLDSSIEASKLGGSIDDVASITNTLASNFGVSLKEASALSAQVFDTSKAIGLSADEGANLFGVLMQTADLSADQAEQLAEGAFQLARQAGVAPSAVMKDIAASSEVVATFTKDGGDNIAQAAVQARQLGVSLNDTAKIAEGLLDFESSLTKEVEASALIGRQVNLQKAREAALNNDIAGAMEEVVKQMGSEEEFNKLNAIQRKALADSIGVGADQLAKFVGQQDKLTLSDALTTQAFEGVSGQEALSQISQLTNTFASLGVTLTNALGPALMFIAKGLQLFLSPIAAIMSGLDSMNALMPVITAGVLGYGAGLAFVNATKIKGIAIETARQAKAAKGIIVDVLSGQASLGAAAAKFFLGASSGSAATLGFGTPALVAIAAAAVALMYSMVVGFNKGGMIGRDGGIIASSDTVPIMGTPGEIILNEAQQANVVSTMQSKPIVERQVPPQPQIAQNFGTQNAMQNSSGLTKEDLKSVFSEVTIPITGEFKQGTVKMANNRDLGSVSQTSTVPV